MRVTELHHLAIKARDPRRLADFYRDAFGLEELRAHRDEQGLRSVWLAVGTAILMIERAGTEGPRPEPLADPPGLHLLALRIPAGEHAEWRQHLGRLGVPVRRHSDFTLYIEDPEGNRVGLSSWPDVAETS